jgi:hypothetical protein
MSSIKRSSALIITSVLLGSVVIGKVSAAPQILAVASTTVPIPMQCDRAECVVELSAICLQEHRSSPLAGTKYYLPKGQKFAFIARSKDGRKIGLPSNLQTRIVTARGHNAVHVSLAWKTIRDYGIENLALSVPAGTALIPISVVGDTDPQTDTDIELATGLFRDIATELVDNDTTKRKAAELVNLTINKLDFKGRSSVAIREQAIAILNDRNDFNAEATALAKKAVTQCDTETQVGYQSLRQCLGSSHDQLIGKLNTKYWNQVKGGS